VRFPVLTWGFFLEGEDPVGDHGLGSLVEFRFKAPPGTSSRQRNCASWASQPQKSVTLRPQPGGEATKSIRDMWWHWKKETYKLKLQRIYIYIYLVLNFVKFCRKLNVQ
jgi:hypothetical protein